MKIKILTKIMWLVLFFSSTQMYAKTSDVLCGIDQFYSEKLNRQSIRKNIVTMINKYGTTAEIYEKLVQLSKAKKSDLDDEFWLQYGAQFMNISISVYESDDHAIIELLLEKKVLSTKSPPGEYAPIIAVINFDRYKVLELLFEKGLVLSECQIRSLYEYSIDVKKDRIAKFLLQKLNSKKNCHSELNVS